MTLRTTPSRPDRRSDSIPGADLAVLAAPPFYRVGLHSTRLNESMQALINETEKMIAMVQGDDLRDAALIASVQKVEHYEIAAYGVVCQFGRSARPAR
jgi:Domain of unknown function (DUF892)